MNEPIPPYGHEDTSFRTAGGEQGIRQLVDAFYDVMEELPQAEKILKMHPRNLEISRDKLARFLAGWLGGPKLYREKYGPIRIPVAHRHLPIGPEERDAWLACMEKAVAKQENWPDSFKTYFMREIAVPAERSRNRD